MCRRRIVRTVDLVHRRREEAMGMTRRLGCLTVLATVTVVLVACESGATGEKAGGGAAPVTLRIGTADKVGRPAGYAIQEFVRQASALSGGRLSANPSEAAEEGADDWDQAVARMVVGGQLDLGTIPARARDTEGVASLCALHAPFLVTSDALVGQIVTSDLASELLAGLDTAGE
jgi:TRAP-type C4-dicarboxylate transport system substrate-binding protein